jgi:hypothetical protein
MSPHSQPRHAVPRRAPTTDAGFLSAWHRLIGPLPVPPLPRRRGRKPRVPVGDLLAALTYHVLQGVGTLAQHTTELFGTTLADSSWSDRRQRLPWDIFAELMRRVLQPRAPAAHADAFWRGWRLLAVDGTQFSLTNTAQVRAARLKTRSRRGRAAFAKLTTVVLVELGLHNPSGRWRGRCSGRCRRRRSCWATACMAVRPSPRRRWPRANGWAVTSFCAPGC